MKRPITYRQYGKWLLLIFIALSFSVGRGRAQSLPATAGKPLSLKYIACEGASIVMGFTSVNGVTYFWYDNETGGNLIQPTASDAISRTKTGNAIQTFWAEPRYNGVSFPRYRVDLEPSNNCGTTSPEGCAATGTVIWKEDFGGNNSSAPQKAPNPGWYTSGKTTYGYKTTSGILPWPGEYLILKSNNGESVSHAHPNLDDHTYPSINIGYFLNFDAAESPGQFYSFDITGLCPSSKLTFSAWLMNINPPSYKTAQGNNYLYPNVSFVIEDVSGTVLATFHTGIIDVTASQLWVNYAFNFTVPAGITQVKVRFMNNQTNTNGHYGNDISIDDIEVRFCAPEVILTQPTKLDTTVCVETSFTFEGSYTDDNTFGNNFSYRWEKNTDIDNPLTWTTISTTQGTSTNGTVNSTYTISPVSLSSAGYYRLVVANEENIGNYNCRAISNIVHLQTVSGVTAGTISANQTICNGTVPVQLTTTQATGGSGTFTYQWEQKAEGSSTWINASGSSMGTSYSPPALTVTTRYRLKVTRGTGTCSTAYSNEILITVRANLTAGAVGSAQTICYNTTPAEFTQTTAPSGGTGTYTYQWQSSANNSTWENISATSATYAPGALTASTYFRRGVTSGDCATVYSESVLITVTPRAAADDITANGTTICSGLTASLTASASGVTSPAYNWYETQTSMAVLSSAASYTTPALTATTTYYVSVSGMGLCENATGGRKAVTVTVNPVPTVTITNQGAVCAGSTRTLDYTSNPTAGSATWTSDNTSVATVNSTTGVVTGIAAGTANITCTVTTAEGCTGSTTYEITVNSVPNYPDIRISVCPEVGNISLSKYIDTIDDVTGIQWSSPISSISVSSPDGMVSTGNLFPAVYTLTYTIDGICVSGQQRKVYLEILKNDRIRTHKDTVVMCYRYADAVQINQIVGVEANGTWDYPSAIASYVKQTSYGGMIMNGKEIYENDIVPDYNYHGVKAKMIEFKYQSDNNGCLKGKEYKTVIILTDDMTN
jgi:hypothetical protein